MDRRPHETAKRNALVIAIAAMVRQLNALGLVLRELERKYTEAVRALETFLEINEEILNPTTRQRSWHYIVLGGFVVAWLLDTIVFGPAASHLVRRAVPSIPILTPVLGFVAAVGVPLLIISVEVLLGSLVHRFGDRRSPDFHRGKQIAAAFGGISVAVAITVIVLSLDLAQQEANGGGDGELSYHQMSFYALALLTLALHLSILFLGEKGAAAKDFAIAHLKLWKLERVVAGIRKALAKKRAEFVELATTYIQEVGTVVQTYGEVIPWGPFCDAAEEQFRRHFPHLRIAAGSLSPTPDAARRPGGRPSGQATHDDDVVIEVDPENAN